MSLSSDLISQFVKVTKDEKKATSETTVYGKTVEYNGSIYVQLDGSELLTPVSNTANIGPNERVMVMIKNHTATVTGNLTSPSARIITDEDGNQSVEGLNVDKIIDEIAEFEIIVANKVSTEELEVERGRIDTLVSDNVNIKDRITANEGDIDTLQTEYLTVTEKLSANEASIENLKATKLDVTIADAKYVSAEELDATNATVHNLEVTYGEFASLTADRLDAVEGDIVNLNTDKLDAATAEITYATIAALDVEKGRINELTSDVADIDTLIFGSASGDTIHTSFANAVIAQLGEAQIKSAMIDSISANKITAGDIITNNVRVMSEDGSLVISDETLQISDGTRVRVQIGKDEANDYSINIWDQNGNLMFSKGGITDAAIKDSIIRNDMVSDTANIAAHKLDIDSLFEEINNNNTKTINSTKVYLDDKSQTLDVAFTSLTTAVDNIDIGGRNLLRHTGELPISVFDYNTGNYADYRSSGVYSWSSNNSIFSDTGDGVKLAFTGDATDSFGLKLVYDGAVESGEEVTLSFDYRGNITDFGTLYFIQATDSNISFTGAPSLTASDADWQHFSWTFKAHSANSGTCTSLLMFYGTKHTDGDWIEVRKESLKLERGNKETDWTPAYEDMDADLSALSNTVISQGTQITAIQGQIASKVWQQDINTATESMSTKYSALEQDLDSISATVESHTTQISGKADSSTVTEVNTKVSELETSLGGFQTTVSETYATKTELSNTQDDIDNLEIGGRNLALKTNTGKTNWYHGAYDGTYSVTSYTDTDGVNCVKMVCDVASTSWSYGSFVLGDSLSKLVANTKYTVSFDMLTDISEPLNLSIRRSDGLMALTPQTTSVQTQGDENWHRYVFALTTNDLSVGLDDQVIYFSRFAGVGYRIIKNLKLERGTRPTDWTPAPEDLETEVDTLASRVTTAETKITQNTNSIALCATKTEVATTLEGYSTTSEMNAAIQLSADGINSTVSEVRQDLDDLTIGGRNLFYGYGDEEIRLPDYQGVGGFKQFHNCLTFDPAEFIGKEFTVSFYAKSPNGPTSIMVYNQNGQPRYFYFSKKLDDELGDEWKYYTYTFTNEDRGDTYTATYNRIEIYAASQLDVVVKKIKLEMGNRATDWTPAPEDMGTAQDTERAQTTADEALDTATNAETLVQQLSDSISMLVTDGNGTSLMTQTEDGWTFSTAHIQAIVDKTSEDLSSLANEFSETDHVVSILQQAVDDLGVTAEYIRIGTYEDEPCIELGESDSDFKLIITNTRILFMEGTSVPAYINNQSLHITKAVIEEEIQQGEFVWKVRANGNMGLMWKGEV